ncbi:MAG TPA: hypothetical protein VI753_05685 [Anaerolineales bacterium]|nr:hypothetical protein [Anaerolineales bacterium]
MIQPVGNLSFILMNNHKLRVFPSTPSARHRLYHPSHDKPIVPELYQRLNAVPQGDDKGWIDPWLDRIL